MPNFKAYINTHNKRLLKNMTNEDPPIGTPNCSCPRAQKANCPLNGRCKDKNLIYQAEVLNSQDDTKEYYIGATSTTFKERLGVHKQSFKNRNQCQTTLSRHIWALKDSNINYELKYKIISKAQPYNPKFKQCGLCLKETTIIITQPEISTLNKRNELTSKCMHRDKFLLGKVT